MIEKMEAAYLPSVLSKVPSPTGSEDSGLGWSPSPTTSERRFHLESPGKHDLTKKNIEETRYYAYSYDDPKMHFMQLSLPGMMKNSETDMQKLFLPPAEKHSYGLQGSVYNLQHGNACSKDSSKKDTSSEEGNIFKSKLDRCLLPKTGNGKPRQTSTKRKINQKSKLKSKPYPGVRVPTVRQRLDQLTAEKRQKEHAQALSTCFVNRRGASLHPYSHPNAFIYPEFSPNKSLSTTRHQSTGVFNGLLDTLSSSTFQPTNQISSSTCQQQVLNSSSHFSTNVTPPNVTISTQQSQFEQLPYCIADHSSSSPNSYYNGQQSNLHSPIHSNVSSPMCLVSSPVDSSSSFKALISPPYQTWNEQHDLVQTHTNVIDQNDIQQSSFHSQPQIQHIYNDDRSENCPRSSDLALEKSPSGLLPIFNAVRNNDVELVRLLLNDPFLCHIAPDGTTVLHEAAALSLPDVLNLLLSALTEWQILKLINTKSSSFGGFTALHIAAQCGNVESMKLLLQCGADLLAKTDDDSNYTTLHIAVKNCNKNAAQVLVEFAKDPTRRCDVESALSKQDSKMNEKSECLSLLLCQQDSAGNTPLHFAAGLQSLYGKKEPVVQVQSFLIRYLLDNGADRSSLNSEYKTPFYLLPSVGSFPQADELHALLRTDCVASSYATALSLPVSMQSSTAPAGYVCSSLLHEAHAIQLNGTKVSYFN